MKNSFQEGERVAAYDTSGRRTGKVTRVDGVYVYVDHVGFHAGQCRRIKKRERRRVWVNIYRDGKHHAHSSKEAALRASESTPQCPKQNAEAALERAVEFIEVRKK